MNQSLISATINFPAWYSSCTNLSRKILLKHLKQITTGKLILSEGNQRWVFGQADAEPVVVRVTSNKFYSALIFGGSVAAAETYVLGYWHCDDLTKLLRILLSNQHVLSYFEKGITQITSCLRWLKHQIKRNTVIGSRKNIAAHYDLSNDFFALFLDKNLMYSCAIYPTTESSLEDASLYKLNVICQKLALKPGDKVIEIGSGWGGFAIYAAENYGCNITTTTISQEQYQFVTQRITEKNLNHKITVLQKDYRLLEGKYDKLVSIEMIEAVGHQYYETFFETCARLLKPEGKMLLQAITIQDQQFDRAKHEIDFIKKYIFPGSCIPSVTALLGAMTSASDLRLFHLEDIGLHYAKTLRNWRSTFLDKQQDVKSLGFDDAFIRLWDFYFCYCEAGFAEGYLANMHMVCTKPAAIKEK